MSARGAKRACREQRRMSADIGRKLDTIVAPVSSEKSHVLGKSGKYGLYLSISHFNPDRTRAHRQGACQAGIDLAQLRLTSF